MLTFTGSDEKHNNCFFQLGTGKSSKNSVHLITNQTSLLTLTNPLSNNSNNGFDTCSFYSEPSDASILAYGETCGSIAMAGETCGSIASAGGETCGSIASSSCGASFSGCFSYSC